MPGWQPRSTFWMIGSSPRREAGAHLRRRDPRGTRPGPLPRQLVDGQAGLRVRAVAAAQGADVTLVAANVELPDPAGVKVVRVVSARDMHAAMLAEAAGTPT